MDVIMEQYFASRDVRFHGLPDRGISPLRYSSTDARMLGNFARAALSLALVE